MGYLAFHETKSAGSLCPYSVLSSALRVLRFRNLRAEPSPSSGSIHKSTLPRDRAQFLVSSCQWSSRSQDSIFWRRYSEPARAVLHSSNFAANEEYWF